MTLASSAYEEGKPIPTKYAYGGVTGGKNISVPLAWHGAPPEAKSFALSIVDPHPVAKNWIHWLVINIPPNTGALAEGASGARMPEGSMELYNSYGELGYGGPEPPKGSGRHPYIATLYALDTGRLDLTANTTLPAFERAIEGHVIASARSTGTYER
jgi:Raf kinase inhibitor-like YbhB/YbcL family protein